MAVKFLEPGGDAIQTQNTGVNNFFTAGSGGFLQVTDIVHGGHTVSLRAANNAGYQRYGLTPAGVVSDAGGRVSFWIYVVGFTTSGTPNTICMVSKVGTTAVAQVRLTSAGIVQLWEASAQIGSNGPTLTTGGWYRISIAYTVTSTTVNRFEVKVFDSSGTNQVGSISVTNATITNTASTLIGLGNMATDATGIDYRFSDIYIDDSNALTDPGNIWVAAKRPVSNGTTNDFITQIGSGGSGYGSGHAPQVNERPLSTTNGWSLNTASTQIVEEYNIEGLSVGNISIRPEWVVDYVGWFSGKVAYATAAADIILNGTFNAITLTTTATLFTKVAGSATYPAGTGADIGMRTSATLTTYSLYECGVLVAYIPKSSGNFSSFM